MIGVNSELDSGNHILMWDFDNIPLDEVKESLGVVQSRYMLSDIHIARTKEPEPEVLEYNSREGDATVKTPATYGNYVAYCFSSQVWRTACEIVAQTPNVDWQFFRFGVYRGHFTLRVTPKGDREIKFADRLEGYSLPDCKPPDLNSWVKYETLNWR